MKEYSKVILSSGKDLSLRRFHPWVFSGAIKKIKGEVQEGDIVEVFDNKDEYLGTGHCQQGSIAVRVFSFERTDAGKELWKEKVLSAWNYRRQLGLTDNPQTNCYRLVFAEGDGMPGLIIDYYNGTAVFQAHSIGMHISRNEIVEAMKEVMGDKLKAVYDKSEETLPKEGYEAKNGYLYGQSESNEVLEHGCRFIIDWEGGQKTGFFLDQRENRKLLMDYCKDKAVLNTFCYTGGFSVYAAKAGARLVHSVDSSKKAIDLTVKNMELNFPGNSFGSFAEDTFDFIDKSKEVYDVIILDPPAFAKHRDAKHHAMMGYKRLNSEAIKKIAPGGILFTFSCSQVVDRNLFESTVMAAAIIAKRKVRVLHHLTQPPDHAPSIYHPEGAYLKGLVLEIE